MLYILYIIIYLLMSRLCYWIFSSLVNVWDAVKSEAISVLIVRKRFMPIRRFVLFVIEIPRILGLVFRVRCRAELWREL